MPNLSETGAALSAFESAVDAVITGDMVTLQALLHQHPELARARSARPHRATLLHYIAANGVENERQKTPHNAVDVAQVLLESGAEVDAAAETYGGGSSQTTLNLLVSSVHPARAGLQVALLETLLDSGAAINGVDNDGSPLMTALAFHYPAAAEALARRGARVDTIVTAAGLGRDDLVEIFLNEDPPDDTSDVQQAFVWAAMHRRVRVVELMLRKGIDPAAKDRRGWTALHWASHYGYPETVRMLLDWNAPLGAHNEFGATPLEQTVWTTLHEQSLPEHAAIIQMLKDASAATQR